MDGGGLVTKSCLTLATPWTVPHQAPLPIGFSRKEVFFKYKYFRVCMCVCVGFPGGTSSKESACQPSVRDTGLIPGWGRSPGGNGNWLQYSRLESPMDRGAWQAAVHRVAKNQTQPSV